MSSLVNFITFTKGIEYLLAIGLLSAFLAFWQWQHHRGRGLLARTIPLIVVALGFGGLASTCIGASATRATATSGSQQWPNVDEAHYLANVYGPAKFAAHEMGPDIVSCQTCHHHSPAGEQRPCRDCHSAPFDGESPDKPGLKAAYHRRCADCHKDAFSGPMTCTKCHTEKPESTEFKKNSPSPATAPLISHSLLDRYGNCVACHNPEGPLPLPGNHSDYKANVVCLGCHKPSVDKDTAKLMPTAAAKVGTPPPAAQRAAATAIATAVRPTADGAQPKVTTHPVQGRESCLMCHGQGVAGASMMPTDHLGRSNDSCLLCHKPSQP